MKNLASGALVPLSSGDILKYNTLSKILCVQVPVKDHADLYDTTDLSMTCNSIEVAERFVQILSSAINLKIALYDPIESTARKEENHMFHYWKVQGGKPEPVEE